MCGCYWVEGEAAERKESGGLGLHCLTSPVSERKLDGVCLK